MDSASNIRHGRSCVYNLQVHLVFVTKYRHPVFQKEHIDRMQQIFAKVCQDTQAALLECNGELNHVHLLISYPPQVAISTLINSLKGVSSRLLRKEYQSLAQHYHNGHLWSPSYYAGSCGGVTLDILHSYIENQSTPA